MKLIYGLVDPRDDFIRYIGQTENIHRRLSEHLASDEQTAKGAWIRGLRMVGLVPRVVILAQHADDKSVSYWESWWITLGRREGWGLTNGTFPGAWRTSDDFKSIFADELTRMYKEHQLACDELNQEAVGLAVERKRLEWMRKASIPFCLILSAMTILSAAGTVAEVSRRIERIGYITPLELFQRSLIAVFALSLMIPIWVMWWYSKEIDIRDSFELRVCLAFFSIAIVVWSVLSANDLLSVFA
jgi:predicted GIY-YIG superfamily endonuclease